MNTHTPQQTAEQDLAERMRPTTEQVIVAVAAAHTAGTAYALVPIAFPGKTWGFWRHGQEVEHPDGAWPTTGGSDYSEASQAASVAAAVALGERPGTVGWTVIDREGNWSVFESPLTPLVVLAR